MRERGSLRSQLRKLALAAGADGVSREEVLRYFLTCTSRKLRYRCVRYSRQFIFRHLTFLFRDLVYIHMHDLICQSLPRERGSVLPVEVNFSLPYFTIYRSRSIRHTTSFQPDYMTLDIYVEPEEKKHIHQYRLGSPPL